MYLSQTDVETLSGLLERLYAVNEQAAFPAAVVEVLRTLVPGTCHAYNQVDVVRQTVQVTAEPADLVRTERLAALAEHLSEHPLIDHSAATRDGRALAISDLLSPAEFQRTGLYDEFYRHIDAEDQIAISQITLPIVVGLAVNRDRRGFSERERLLLNLLRPHLASAHRHAADMTLARHATEATNVGVVRLTRDWRIADADERASALLSTYFGRGRWTSPELPDELRAWARMQSERLRSDPSAPLAALDIDCAGARLTVRFVPGTPYDGAALLLCTRNGGLSLAGVRQLGLSPRETEVMRLLATGASDAEIATTLVISRHTVHRHLQNVYGKLGVRNRSAAVARILALDVNADS